MVKAQESQKMGASLPWLMSPALRIAVSAPFIMNFSLCSAQTLWVVGYFRSVVYFCLLCFCFLVITQQ